jgi:hypothetical protein
MHQGALQMPIPSLPLFVYGTLRDADLLRGVLGRAMPAGEVLAATAPGFRAVPYPGRAYPALVRVPGGTAPGLLLLGLSGFERDLLDAYEGEEYRRAAIAVMVEEELHEADAYLPAAAEAVPGELWSLNRWQTEHKARAIVGEIAAANAIRARLIATGPN